MYCGIKSASIPMISLKILCAELVGILNLSPAARKVTGLLNNHIVNNTFFRSGA